MRTICLVVCVLEGAWLCSSLLYVRPKTFLATKLPLIDSQTIFSQPIVTYGREFFSSLLVAKNLS